MPGDVNNYDHVSITQGITEFTNGNEKKLLRIGKAHNRSYVESIDPKDAKLYEKALAKFGLGPLSLKNVVKFYTQYDVAHGASTQTNSDLRKAFLNKLSNVSKKYNTNRSFVKTIAAADMRAIFKFSNPVQGGSTAISCTYSQSPGKNGIIDFGFFSKKHGTIGVFDGTGHNNPTVRTKMSTAIDEFKTDFHAKIEDAFVKSKINSEDELKDFLVARTNELKRKFEEIREDDGSLPPPEKYNPAFVLGQIVNINGTNYLATTRGGDSQLGVFDTTTGSFRQVTNVDSSGLTTPPNNTFDCQVIKLEPTDEIYAFTDGITEFLTKAEIERTIADKREGGTEVVMDALKTQVYQRAKGLNETRARQLQEIQTARNAVPQLCLFAEDPDAIDGEIKALTSIVSNATSTTSKLENWERLQSNEMTEVLNEIINDPKALLACAKNPAIFSGLGLSDDFKPYLSEPAEQWKPNVLKAFKEIVLTNIPIRLAGNTTDQAKKDAALVELKKLYAEIKGKDFAPQNAAGAAPAAATSDQVIAANRELKELIGNRDVKELMTGLLARNSQMSPRERNDILSVLIVHPQVANYLLGNASAESAKLIKSNLIVEENGQLFFVYEQTKVAVPGVKKDGKIEFDSTKLSTREFREYLNAVRDYQFFSQGRTIPEPSMRGTDLKVQDDLNSQYHDDMALVSISLRA